MDMFIARLNIEHFRKQLAEETDETKRQLLLRLLAEEEAKFAGLTAEQPNRSETGIGESRTLGQAA
jgi:hypothetical protein